MTDAACRRGNYPVEFFDAPAPPDAEDAAMSVCHHCPVEAPCLLWALDHERRLGRNGEPVPRFHIYGGMRTMDRAWLASQIDLDRPADVAAYVADWRNRYGL